MMASAAPAIIAARTRRKVARDLRAAGAFDEASAISIAPLHPAIARRQFDRLVAAGAVCETKNGLYWLDEAAYAAAQLRRRGIVLGVLATGCGIVALGALFG